MSADTSDKARLELVEQALADILDWYHRTMRGEVSQQAGLVAMRCRTEMALEQLRAEPVADCDCCCEVQ